jgi:predicted RNase H-like nuclease
MGQTIFGFDSAWTDNPKAPGALCAIRITDAGVTFAVPELANFSRAAELIRLAKQAGDFVLVALDQPTIVPNQSGGRPVEKVAASIISSIRGGVQPSSRSRLGMFDDAAPVWRFLKQIDCIERPEETRSAVSGSHIIEVFPALALASLVPLTWSRRGGAKYNPANKNFDASDWVLVCTALENLLTSFGLGVAADWCRAAAELRKPKKADQDKLDAVICLAVAVLYRFGGAGLNTLMIGDLETGYMITPASKPVSDKLLGSAQLRGIRGVSLSDPAPAREPIMVPRELAAHRPPTSKTSIVRSGAGPLRTEANETEAIVKLAPRRTRSIQSGKTTNPGYVNRNDQRVERRTELPGNDHNQVIYVLACLTCAHQYGANGSGIFQCKCPRCQNGAPGLAY